ncbi:hypothetical protein V8C37DRAFT_386722 [Trichoderma ceciliae]
MSLPHPSLFSCLGQFPYPLTFVSLLVLCMEFILFLFYFFNSRCYSTKVPCTEQVVRVRHNNMHSLTHDASKQRPLQTTESYTSSFTVRILPRNCLT